VLNRELRSVRRLAVGWMRRHAACVPQVPYGRHPWRPAGTRRRQASRRPSKARAVPRPDSLLVHHLLPWNTGSRKSRARKRCDEPGPDSPRSNPATCAQLRLRPEVLRHCLSTALPIRMGARPNPSGHSKELSRALTGGKVHTRQGECEVLPNWRYYPSSCRG
jgi:hypothetical protein